MQGKARRRIIDLSKIQPVLDFDQVAHNAEFTLPSYQRGILLTRSYAFIVDVLLVSVLCLIFTNATLSEMTESIVIERPLLGIYGAAYFLFLAVYFFLFMFSMSQTTGMRYCGLVAVNREGTPLQPREAFMRSFGYLVSIVPLLFGFLWAFVDPDHLTWADKMSGTFIKRVD